MIAKLRMANVAIVILAFALTNVQADYDAAKYCQIVPKFTKFPSFESCKSYYICNSPTEVTKKNCPNNEVFNKDKADCVPEKDSNCLYGVENPCVGKNDGYVRDPKNCRMWQYCENGQSKGSGTCKSGQYFDGKQCVNGKCPYEYVNKNGVTEVKDICNIMKVGMFFGDFNNCATWNKCLADHPMENGSCIGEKHPDYVLDLELQACVPYAKAVCERTGGVTTENDHQNVCKDGDKYGDSSVCSKYHKCASGQWILSECPNNEYFDTLTNECKDRQKATPVNTCDRCQFTNKKWVNAVDTKCSKFLTCEDGKKISEGTCGVKSYFNEQTQLCLTGTTNLGDYSEKNGACKCGLQCQIEQCTNKKCQTDLCTDNSAPECYCILNPLQIICQLKTCKDDINCKKAVCNGDNTEPCKCINDDNNLVCKLKACKDNMECKINVCKVDTNKNENDCKCILKPEDHMCKAEKCLEDNDNEQKKKTCILNVLNSCKSDECKADVCTQNLIKDTDECEFVKCETKTDNDTKKKQIDCMIEFCSNKDDDEKKKKCNNNACNAYGDKANIAKCKLNICNTEQECKEEVCKDSSLSTTVYCKLLECHPEDKACKYLACKGHTDIDECK